jgi:peptide/nickel transport system permease protein
MKPAAMISAFFIFMLLLLALFAPLLSMAAVDSLHLDMILHAPSWSHPFGTDQLGRDIYTRILYGGRISLTVGFVAVSLSFLIGTSYGAIAGFLGGKVDQFMMKIVNILLTLPTIFIILTIQVIFKPSILNIMIIIGLTSWMGLARLVRAEFLSIKERDYILANKAHGFGNFKIITRDILPNAMIPIVVSLTLSMAGAILTESTLSFLGLGVQPPTPSWGNMLMDAQDYLREAWWMAFFPGMLILLTVLSFNFLGEYGQVYFKKRN